MLDVFVERLPGPMTDELRRAVDELSAELARAERAENSRPTQG